MKTNAPLAVLALVVSPMVSHLVLPASARAEYAPEISRSAGKDGGVLIFWTRVIPKTDDPKIHELAKALQDRMQRVVQHAVPSLPIDVRPEPERVCPRDGCLSPTVGTLLVHDSGNCVVVGIVSAKGKSPAKLVPWAGQVRLKAPTVAFREPPEGQIGVDDFVPCGQILTALNEREGEVVKAVQGVVPAAPGAGGPAAPGAGAAPAK